MMICAYLVDEIVLGPEDEGTDLFPVSLPVVFTPNRILFPNMFVVKNKTKILPCGRQVPC